MKRGLYKIIFVMVNIFFVELLVFVNFFYLTILTAKDISSFITGMIVQQIQILISIFIEKRNIQEVISEKEE